MTRSQRTYTLFSLTLMVLASVAYSDTLYLQNGEQHLGVLKSMTADSVVFEGRDGAKTWPKSEVSRIQLQRARKYDEVETTDQITDPDLKTCLEKQPAEQDYPADGSVTLLARHTFDLTTPGVVKDTVRTITKVLRQRGEDAGSNNAWHFEDTDLPEIDFALTITPDGRVLHLSDDAVKNESIYAQLPMYRRLSRLRFACKEPRPGSILDVQYTVIRKRPGDLEPFYAEEFFRDEAPILRKEVVVVAPTGQEPSWQLREPDGTQGAVSLTCKEENGLTRLTWTLDQPQKGIIEEPQMPPRAYFVPSLSIAASTLWEQANEDYATALDKMPALPDTLKQKALDLAQKGGAAAIYDFMARGIRTAPVPQGHFRLAPHAPEEIAQRAFANELDKNFLFACMLQAAGIDCSLALVRSRSRGPIAEEAPSLRAFDRSAVYLTREKRFVTVVSDVLSFGDLPGEMQISPALVIGQRGKGLTVTQRPGLKEELSSTAFDATLDKDGNLEIRLVYAGVGNNGSWLRSMKNLADQEFRTQLEQMASYLHPAAVLKSYEKTDLADLSVPPSLTLCCAIPGYAVRAGDDLMLFNIPAMTYDAGDVGRPTREHGLFWSGIGRELISGSLRLPEGYTVYSAPNAFRFKSHEISYKTRIAEKGGNISIKGAFDQKVYEAPAEAYARYKQGKELRADLARQRVILKRISH